MTLEDRLRALHDKGHLVHLSLAYYGGHYHCNLATAQASGYERVSGDDPIAVLEEALKNTGIKAKKKLTAPVKDVDLYPDMTDAEYTDMCVPLPPDELEASPLPKDWTAP